MSAALIRTIAADCPWPFDDELPGETRGAASVRVPAVEEKAVAERESAAASHPNRYVLRALAKTDVGPGGCWLWAASVNCLHGYAQMKIGGRRGSVVRVHRWLYEQIVGPVPRGLVLDHLCRIRRCVNPRHLEPVTDAENLRRGAGSKRQDTCTKGHAISGANVYRRPSGREECVTCRRSRRS